LGAGGFANAECPAVVHVGGTFHRHANETMRCVSRSHAVEGALGQHREAPLASLDTSKEGGHPLPAPPRDRQGL